MSFKPSFNNSKNINKKNILMNSNIEIKGNTKPEIVEINKSHEIFKHKSVLEARNNTNTKSLRRFELNKLKIFDPF